MSFKLEIGIADDGETSVNFEGDVNHIMLLGVLEQIKHSVLNTADMMSMAENVFSDEAGLVSTQPPEEGAQ